MSEDFVLAFVNDLLGASDRKVEFLRELLEGDPIKEPPSQNGSVSLCVSSEDPFLDQMVDFGSTQIR